MSENHLYLMERRNNPLPLSMLWISMEIRGDMLKIDEEEKREFPGGRVVE